MGEGLGPTGEDSGRIENLELAQEVALTEDEIQTRKEVTRQAATELGLGDDLLRELDLQANNTIEEKRANYERAMREVDSALKEALLKGPGNRIPIENSTPESVDAFIYRTEKMWQDDEGHWHGTAKIFEAGGKRFMFDFDHRSEPYNISFIQLKTETEEE